MSTITLLEDEVCDDNPLDIELEPDLNVTAGFEALTTIFHGLITTPPKRLREPYVRQQLRERLQEVSLLTRHSCEDLEVSLEHLGQYSEENAFIDGVRTVINKILEWLGQARDWFIRLFKKIFDIRTQQKTTSRQTEQTFNSAKKKYTSEESSTTSQSTPKKPSLPQNIEVTVPGNSLLIFHWQKFDPAEKASYTSDALFLSLDKIDKQFANFLSRYQSASNMILTAVDDIIRDIESDKRLSDLSANDRLNRNRFMEDLYKNHWECIGMGLNVKPMRSTYNRNFQQKYSLVNLVDLKGWGAIGHITIRIRTKDFDKLNKDIQKVTDNRLAELIMLNEQFSQSKVLKRLSTLKKTVQGKMSQLENQGVEMSSTLTGYNADVARIEMVYEYVSQMADNAYLMSRFYTRYCTTLTNILSVAAKKLDADA